MKNFATFQILGRIVRTTELNGATKVVAAANYKRRSKEGGLQDDPHFNEVTVFDAQTRSFIREHCAKGDLVHVEGRVRQNSYERDGQTYYTVDLIALDFGLLAKSSVLGKAGAPEDDGGR